MLTLTFMFTNTHGPRNAQPSAHEKSKLKELKENVEEELGELRSAVGNREKKHKERREEKHRADAVRNAGRPDVDLYRFSVERLTSPHWCTAFPPCL